MRKAGLIETIKVGRRVFISQEASVKFSRRAIAGEFSEKTISVSPWRKGKGRV